MKKVMFLSAALVAAAFASCSQDETIDVNNGQGIGFRAFTESQTRAYDVNIDSLKSFTVYALQGTTATLGDAAFVWKDVFNKKSGTANFTSTTTHYWPSSDNMFFFAYNEDALNSSSGAAVTPSISADSQTLPNFTPNTDIDSQKDLLVAYSGSQTENSSNNGAATLHFKHALSQIKVKAKNDDATSLQIKVMGVRINGLNAAATFTYPNAAATVSQTALQTSAWSPASNESNKNGDYIVRFDGEKETAATLLTATAQTIMEADEATGNKSFMVLPQSVTAWDGNTPASDGNVNGAYISVLCQISVPSGVEGGWTQYFPSIIGEDNASNAGKFAWTAIPFPADTTFEPGKCYTYTLKFSQNGAGTTDPDQPKEPGTDPEVPVDPGQPVLGGKLSFDVTVSGWQDSSHEVDMKPSND